MKLIMKADDFGSTKGVTDGIAETIKNGITRDTSFLTNSKHFDYAVEVANKIGLKELGLHLTLTYGEPLLGKDKVPSITQENGKFYRNPQAIPDDFDPKEVEKEFRAQLAQFRKSGLTLTHIDSHHHVHALIGEEVVEIVMQIAKEEGVPVRRQNDSHIPVMKKYGVKSSDYLERNFGGNDEQSTIEHLISILDKYKDKDCILEVMCHPGIVDEELKEISSFTTPREIELATLTSDEIFDYVEENNIELVNFLEVLKG